MGSSVQTQMLIRLIVGLGMTAIVGLLAVRRVGWLVRLVRSGKPAPGHTDDLAQRVVGRDRRGPRPTPAAEVVDPRPGALLHHVGLLHPAHGHIEAYGALFHRDFHIPIIGRWAALGFLQDFFALAVFLGMTTFAIIRLRCEPERDRPRVAVLRLAHRRRLAGPVHDLQRDLDAALFRGSAVNNGNLPYGKARSSRTHAARCCGRWAHAANEVIETVGLLLHIGVMLGFLLIVLHSKHLHIFLAPVNVTFKRLPERSARCCRSTPTASRSTSRTRPRTPSSAAARSRTSPGRACSTSPPAPSAAAASRSARPGTPASRCRPSS